MASDEFTQFIDNIDKARRSSGVSDIKSGDDLRVNRIVDAAVESNRQNNQQERIEQMVIPTFEEQSGNFVRGEGSFSSKKRRDQIWRESKINNYDIEQLRGSTAELWGSDNDEADGIGGEVGSAIKSFFIGQRDEPIGSTEGFMETIEQKGVVGLWGTLLKTDEERAAERYYDFVRSGVDPNRAYEKSIAIERNGREEANLNEREYSQTKSFDRWETAGAVLDSLDIVLPGAGKAIKIGAMRGLRPIFKAVHAANNAAVARARLVEYVPSLANSQEADYLVNIIRNTPEDFSIWQARQVAKNTKIYKEVVESGERTAAQADTAIQRTLRGVEEVPIVKFGDETVEETVQLRDEIRTALRSKNAADGQRLSDPNILKSEVDAGSVPFGAKASDSFAVKSIGRGSESNLTAPFLGERFTLVDEAAEAGTRTQEIPAKNLVRLSDGSFAYAPKERIGESLEPAIQGIRGAKKRAKVEAAEAARAQREEALKTTRESFLQAAKQSKEQKEAAEQAVKEVREEAIEAARRATKEGEKAAELRLFGQGSSAAETAAAQGARRTVAKEVDNFAPSNRTISASDDGGLVGTGTGGTDVSWIPDNLRDEETVSNALKYYKAESVPESATADEISLVRAMRERENELAGKIKKSAVSRSAKETEAKATKKVEKTLTDEEYTNERIKSVKEKVDEITDDMSDSQAAGRRKKGVGMKLSAIKRKLNGNPTKKEVENKLEYLKTNHSGKEVVVDGEDVTLTGNTSFGRHEVKMSDGSTKYVEGDKIISDSPTREDAIQALKEEAEKELQGLEDIYDLDKPQKTVTVEEKVSSVNGGGEAAAKKTEEGLRATPQGSGKSESPVLKTMTESKKAVDEAVEESTGKAKEMLDEISESGKIGDADAETINLLQKLSDEEAFETVSKFEAENSIDEIIEIVQGRREVPSGATRAHFASYAFNYANKAGDEQMINNLRNAMRTTVAPEVRAFGQEASAMRTLYEDNPIMRSYLVEKELNNVLNDKGQLEDAISELSDIINKADPEDEISDVIDDNIC